MRSLGVLPRDPAGATVPIICSLIALLFCPSCGQQLCLACTCPSAADSRQAGRQAGKQTGGQAGRQAGRHRSHYVFSCLCRKPMFLLAGPPVAVLNLKSLPDPVMRSPFAVKRRGPTPSGRTAHSPYGICLPFVARPTAPSACPYAFCWVRDISASPAVCRYPPRPPSSRVVYIDSNANQ
jgi:hypothetical protein